MQEIKTILFPVDFSIAVPKIIPVVKTFSFKIRGRHPSAACGG